MATDFFKIGKATGQQFADVSGAVQRGLEMGLKPFAEYEKSRKERVDALGRILQKTPNLAELPKIPEQYSPKISEWAVNAKNEYAAAARTIVQTSADSPEYQEAVQKINSITNAFVNLDNQLKGIREERIEYLDDYQNGLVSKGFKNSDIEAAYGANGAIAQIDANGNVSMTGNEGRAFLWNERQEHYNVNPYIQKSMVELSTNAKANGLKGISFTQDEYKEQLKAIMSDPKIGNIQALKSLVYDDIDGTALNITQTNPEVLEMLEAETPDLPAIKQKLVDILAPALADVNQTSIGKYNEALQTKNGKGRPASTDKSQADALRYYGTFKQNPIGLFKRYTDITPEFDLKTNIFKATDTDGTELKYDLSDFNERGAFYRKMLEFSGFDKGTRDAVVFDFDTVVDALGEQDYNTLKQNILEALSKKDTTTPEGPALLGSTEYPEEIINLPNTLPNNLDGFIESEILKYKDELTGGRSIGSRIADIKRKLRRLPENQITEKTIARIAYDTYFREAENKRRTSEFEKSEGLKPLLKNINEASTQALGASALERKNVNAVLSAVNKEDAFELTEQDFLIYEYIKQGGSIEDIANNSDDIDKTFA